MLNLSHNKAFKVTAGIIIILVIFLGFIHWKMKIRGQQLDHLRSFNNVIISHVPPKWTRSLPRTIIKFFMRSFPVNIDYNPEENIDLFSNSSEQQTHIKLKDFLQSIASLKRINELKLTIKNDETLYFADDLFQIHSPQAIYLYGDRLNLKNNQTTLNELKEFHLHADSVSPNFLKVLSLSQNLEKLSLHTKVKFNKNHLKYLGNIRSLKHLELSGLNCPPKELKFLKNLTELEYLNLGISTSSIQQKNNQQSLGKYYDISHNLDAVFSSAKLKDLHAHIRLTEANLIKLHKLKIIPKFYCDIPEYIDDSYLLNLQKLLDNIPHEKALFRQGIVDKISLSGQGQGQISDKSLRFLQKYIPQRLDLRGSSLTKIDSLPLHEASEIHFSQNLYNSKLISLLKNDEYKLLDFSATNFNDQDLKALLKQTKVRTLVIEDTDITQEGLWHLIDFYKAHPNERLKVSFGATAIPNNSQAEFLNRVHRWGMLEVFSSHLDQRINFPSWGSHTSKKIIHDRPGYLKNIDYYFPQLTSLSLYGKPLDLSEWQGLSSLKRLMSLALYSQQNSADINASQHLQNLSYLEIHKAAKGPIELYDSMEDCQVNLQKGEALHQVISFAKGSPQSLTVDGQGEINLDSIQSTNNLQTLVIGSGIKLTGTFPKMPKLRYLECQSQLPKRTLSSIQQLPNVETLIGHFTSLDKSVLKQWSSLEKLKNLDLSHSLLKQEDLKSLTSFQQLSSLKFPAYPHIDQKIISLLLGVPSLQKIGLSGTAIPSKIAYEKFTEVELWDFLP